MWKNSSCELSLLERNWMSSTISTSGAVRYRARNSSIELPPDERFWLIIEPMKSVTNFSQVMKQTAHSGCWRWISCPIACRRWVFPKPTPP